MTVYAKRRFVIVAAAAVAVAAAYFASRGEEAHLERSRAAAARAHAEKQIPPALADMREEILAGFDDILFFEAEILARRVRTWEGMTNDQAMELARFYGLDELNFVDTNGVIRASTHPDDQIGFYMGSKPGPAGFLCLLHGERWYHQPPRITEQADGVYRKFFGVPLPVGGYVQLGINFDRISRDAVYRFSELAVGWHIGEHGYFILAVEETGDILSDGNPREHPSSVSKGVRRTLEKHGIDHRAIPASPDETFEAVVSGQPSLCRSLLVPESGTRIIAVIPMDDILKGGRASIAMMMFVPLAVIVLAAGVGLRIVSEQERAAARQAAEEERRRKDLELAAAIQSSSLPRIFPPFPDRKDLDIFANMTPAKEVGGDFFDFYFTTSERVAVLVADVSGKGIPAAMFMMKAKTLINSTVGSNLDLGEAMAQVNDRLSEENDANMFVTAWVGVLDLSTGRLEYVNAGHNPPLLRRASGSFERLEKRSGFILGGMEGSRYCVHSLDLQPGDLLFLYTDGVTEAGNASDELFGDARLLEAAKAADANPVMLCMTVGAAIHRFAGEAPQTDDITMLALSYRGMHRSFPATKESLPGISAFVERATSDTKLLIATDEVATNVVQYSEAKTLDVSLFALNGEMRLSFSDDGRPFNPLERPDPDTTQTAEERKIGGLGIFMVKKMMDSVEYKYEYGRNVLTLIRKV